MNLRKRPLRQGHKICSGGGRHSKVCSAAWLRFSVTFGIKVGSPIVESEWHGVLDAHEDSIGPGSWGAEAWPCSWQKRSSSHAWQLCELIQQRAMYLNMGIGIMHAIQISHLNLVRDIPTWREICLQVTVELNTCERPIRIIWLDARGRVAERGVDYRNLCVGSIAARGRVF